MAIIKHISSKNADYGAAEKYLIYEHDEFTMKPIRNSDGHLIPRTDYQMAVLNCGNEDFAISCIRANMQYGKNNRKGDVKSHHYIISFDPRDKTDHGLTVNKAQELGIAYCKKHFPGHQAIVCTHADGHNHSGNIHVHIVINSLRIQEVERKSYMDRRCDTLAGAKHRCTASAFRYFRNGVMEMCRHHGLYQIDLLSGSRDKVTDNEYWAKKRGQQKQEQERQMQQKQDQINRKSIADIAPSKQIKFETDKERLRLAIRKVLAIATSFEDFSAKLMQEHGILVRESRGRYSYLPPDRNKPISARKLGADYDKVATDACFSENIMRARQADKPQYQTIDRIKALVKREKDKKNCLNYDETQHQASVLRKLPGRER